MAAIFVKIKIIEILLKFDFSAGFKFFLNFFLHFILVSWTFLFYMYKKKLTLTLQSVVLARRADSPRPRVTQGMKGQWAIGLSMSGEVVTQLL